MKYKSRKLMQLFRSLILLVMILQCKEGQEESAAKTNQSKSKESPTNKLSNKPFSALPLHSIPARVGPLQISEWLANHWERPIPPQGEAPEHWTEVEKDLSPKSCGECHTQQYNDWKESRHHKAMGPGVIGQLVDMEIDAPHFSQTCQACHAPMTEQIPFLKAGEPNPLYQKKLRDEGLVCAACHVRQHVRHGPDKGRKVTAETPHDGFVARKEFQDPAFCSTCHDFTEHGNRVNGKLIQETGEEWRRTSFAAEGKTCQSCHMPEGRHLWKGIHDSGMVASAVDVLAELLSSNQGIEAKIAVTNRGAAHRMPTYMTPQITLIFEQMDKSGKAIPGTLKEGAIARRITVDMREELYDTRLMPGQKFDLYYKLPKHADAVFLEARVEVWPDEWYRLFFENMLANPALLPKGGEGHIEQAHREAGESRYVLWEKEWEL